MMMPQHLQQSLLATPCLHLPLRVHVTLALTRTIMLNPPMHILTYAHNLAHYLFDTEARLAGNFVEAFATH